MDTLTKSNKKWKHFIDADNKTYKTALVDGYDYGDRLLEGVMFEITVEDTGDLSIKVEDSAKDYFSQFNEEHWYTTILESVIKNREATIKTGKNSYDEVELIEDSNSQSVSKPSPNPIAIKATKLSELFKTEAAKTETEESKDEVEDESEFENYFDETPSEDEEASNYDVVKVIADAFAKTSTLTNDPAYREMAVAACEEELNGNGSLYPTNTNISDTSTIAYLRNIKAQLQATDDMITATMGMWNNMFANGSITNPNGSNTPPQIILGNTPLQRNPLDLDLIKLLDDIEEDITGVKPLSSSNASTSGNVNPATVNNLNSAIQTMNNGKTNITSNPALNDLGIVDDVEDPEYALYATKLENFHISIKETITEKTEKIVTLNKIIDKTDYWDAHYGLELYNAIIAKFFNKEYLTHPKERFKKVQTFLEEIIYKFNSYLVSISYNIKTEEDIEADVKEFIAKSLLEEHFAISKKEPVKKEKEVTENINFADLGANLTEEKKSKLSDLLRKIEAGESLEKEKEASAIKELSEYDKADLKGKIAIKYTEVHKRAIELDGEEDGLIKTYVEGLYNPATTSLDDKNLLLNLLIVSKMQDISIMKWEFDERRVKVSNTEIDLKHNWWTKILTEEIEEDLKYVKIVEKDLNLAFYTSLFSDLIKKADKLSYGERNLKFKKLLADGDEDVSREGLLLDTLLKKTQEGSVLFITPDMEKWVQTENIIHDELGDKGQIRYIGIWKERHIFVINVDKIRGLEQYSNEIIFLNKGNSYVLNPEKPIVYFNVIENPFLERPIIKWYAGAEFDISMDKAARMRVDNNFLE